MPPPESTSLRDAAVVLRRANADDEAGLVRLAALDSAQPLAGPAFVAEQNGALVAALCLSTGRTVANPFVPSMHLVELLRRHVARQDASAGAGRGRRLLPRLALRAG
jgi:hypothetical protein